MPKSVTLPELTHRWLQESLGVFSQDTLDHYRDLLENHVYTYFGDKVEISEKDIRTFLDAKKQKGLSDSTVKKLFLVLRRILEYGASLNLCRNRTGTSIWPRPNANTKPSSSRTRTGRSFCLSGMPASV